MRRFLALALACSTACGRFGFDASATNDPDAAAGADAPPMSDGPSATTRCNEGPTLFCDGFETGTLDAWNINTGAGTLVVATDTPFMGGFALRATAGVGGFAFASITPAPIADGELYLRLHMRLPSNIPIAPPEVQLFRIGRETDNGHIHFLIDNLDAPVVWPEFDKRTGTVPLQRDKWLCLTAHVVFGPTGSVELAVDDVPVVTITDTAIGSGDAGYDEISVGVVETGGSQPQLGLLVDEVAVARTPLPCT